MSANNTSEVYISVDIEAAGPIPGTYSMLSLGACVVGAPENSFYVELKPINANVVPEAVAVSGFTLEELLEKGEEPKAAIFRLGAWVRHIAGVRTAVLVGFNASFDWSFVNWYFHTYVGENPFGFAPLDIKAYYMGLTGCLWKETTSRQIPPAFQPERPAREHHALDDARAQAETFAKLLATRRADLSRTTTEAS